jgi:hypothetical protein
LRTVFLLSSPLVFLLSSPFPSIPLPSPHEGWPEQRTPTSSLPPPVITLFLVVCCVRPPTGHDIVFFSIINFRRWPTIDRSRLPNEQTPPGSLPPQSLP